MSYEHLADPAQVYACPRIIPRRIYDSAANKAPLSARTNQEIGGNAPSDYLGYLLRENPDIEDALTSSRVPISTLESDDFVGFFVERGVALTHMIYAAMGKDDLPDCAATFQDALKQENLTVTTDEYDDDVPDEPDVVSSAV